MLYTLHQLTPFLHSFGYLAIFLVIAGESMGIPLPGETLLLSSAIYAGTTHQLNVFGIILAAFLGAVIGDNLGFVIGYYGGFPLLKKFARVFKIKDSKIKVGQYLFMKHGGKIVFFGRFVSILRTWAAFLAGVNRMPWKRFLFFNAAGGLLWSTFYGILGFGLGRGVHWLSRPLRYTFFVVGTLFVVWSFFYIEHNIRKLEKKAEEALPGPLK